MLYMRFPHPFQAKLLDKSGDVDETRAHIGRERLQLRIHNSQLRLHGIWELSRDLSRNLPSIGQHRTLRGSSWSTGFAPT